MLNFQQVKQLSFMPYIKTIDYPDSEGELREA